MWLVDAIVNSSIYAAKPEDLNDPFDCQIDIEFELKKTMSNQHNHENTIIQKALNGSTFIDNWRNILSSCGVVSFSQNNEIYKVIDSILMWTHYADEHKGVCLEYLVDDGYIKDNWIGSEKDNTLVMCRCVKYEDELSLNCLNNTILEENEFIKDLLVDYLTTKTKPWSYENEGRIVFMENGPIDLPRQALVAVRFGLKSSNNHVSLIKRILSDYSPQTRVFKAIKEQNKIIFIDV
ncbi:DUF2971 domain-containing protein [Aeromonas encheleia]|uniref:DUF2971 domain-containing protein n=1 Tax=Aeromonas encheleia TaxID=73010 RepID=UPI001F585ABF|nr:DUF2971 domain-containing protein [Aeromonas encheleia]UNP88988.1 DUF2971 domain-containing protein [Aeromonas encheleia]